MRTITTATLVIAIAGAASAEIRSSSSFAMEKEVLSGGGGSTSSAGLNAFSSFAQPQTGAMRATPTAQLGFLAGGIVPPSAPQNLTAISGDARVILDWDDNTEPNLAGYNVYRSETSGGGYAKVNAAVVLMSGYTDTGVTNGTTYYYVVRAVIGGAIESDNSNEASAKPLGAGVLGGGCGAGTMVVFALLLFLRRRRS